MDNRIIITDDLGKEHNFDIVFTFDDEDEKHHYALVTNGDDNFFVFEFFEETGEILIVEDQNILDKAQKLLDDFDLEQENYEKA